MFLKKITLLNISIVLLNGILIFFILNPFYGPTKISDQLSQNVQQYELRNVQLYEDCFNGIDDDGDGLIDKMDKFEC